MKQIVLSISILTLTALPLAAQENDPGSSLMERGAQLFLEGLLKEMEPAIDDLSDLAEEFGPSLREFAQEVAPQLKDLLDQVDDWTAYHAPEILPNGDIVIRRKSDRPLPTPEDIEAPSDPVDL